PVAGVGIAALGAAMVEVAQYGQCLCHNVMGPAPGQIGNKADAAGIVLEPAIVQSLALCAAGASTAGPGEAARRAAGRGGCAVTGGSGGSPPRASTAGPGGIARRGAARGR